MACLSADWTNINCIDLWKLFRHLESVILEQCHTYICLVGFGLVKVMPVMSISINITILNYLHETFRSKYV